MTENDRVPTDTDLSAVDLPDSVISDLKRYVSVVNALGAGNAMRYPFDLARTLARPFRNNDRLSDRIGRLEDEVCWEGHPGSIANTVTGQIHLNEATVVVLRALHGKSRQAVLDARIAAKRAG